MSANSSSSDGTKIRRVLVAIDGSDDSKRASAAAISLSERVGGDLVVLNVLPGITILGALASRAPIPQSAYDKYFNYADKKAYEIVDEQVSLAKGRVSNVKGIVVRTSIQS